MRPVTRALKAFFRCPRERRAANLDAAAFDHQVVLWSTVQNGVYGHLDPKSGQWPVFYLRVELAQTARAAPCLVGATQDSVAGCGSPRISSEITLVSTTILDRRRAVLPGPRRPAARDRHRKVGQSAGEWPPQIRPRLVAFARHGFDEDGARLGFDRTAMARRPQAQAFLPSEEKSIRLSVLPEPLLMRADEL
jgi:hypothetical protein